MSQGEFKYYAVREGREGPRLYDCWREAREQVEGYPGALFKSFRSLREAQDWLANREHCRRHTSPSLARTRSGNMVKAEHASLRSKEPDSSKDGPVVPTGPFPLPPSVHENDAFPPASQPGTLLDIAYLMNRQDGELMREAQQAPAPPSPPAQAIELSAEQLHVLDRVRAGHNVFFTGSAGTGKSVLLREIIKLWKDQPREVLAITASTGIASVNVGGQTLHSWAGIGLGKLPAEKLKWVVGKNDKLRRRWRFTECLIIDEISMIDGTLFDKLEYIARFVRERDAPFGGIQLVVSGDFCQLPPVPDYSEKRVLPSQFAFDSRSWDACMGQPVYLTKVFRQRDEAFIDMLNAMRFGNLDDEMCKKFRELSRPLTYNDGIGPTELYPTKIEVEKANHSRLSALKGKKHVYKALDIRGIDEDGNQIPVDYMQRLLDKQVAPKQITLMIGAQVMLIKNAIQGVLVNGSTGVVVDFMTYAEAARRGKPVLRDPIKPDKSGKPQKDPMELLLKTIERLGGELSWPLVQFAAGREMLCVPVDFSCENWKGDREACRTQVPLILAWALSVHKSQGQTLERVKIDLRRTFEMGQAYVALSRATKLETLEVLNFDPSKVKAHPRVIEWMRAMGMPLTANASSSRAPQKDLPRQSEPMEVTPEDEYDAYMDEDDAIASYFASTSTSG